MVVVAAMIALCTIAVGFYLRFLIALLHECKRSRICYLVRLRPDAIECAIPEGQDIRESVSFPRAA